MGDKNDFEQVKLLFDYTKFHIGVYTTAASVLVAVVNTEFGRTLHLPPKLIWTAVLLIAVAGLAGGTIASTLPHCKTIESFMSSKVGPYRSKALTGEAWTYVEHTAFWAAIASVLIAFWNAA